MALYFNDTEVVEYQDSVFINGTEVENVYFNDTKVWTRHPYAIDTDVFTYSWSNGSNIDDFRTTYYNSYPLAFAGQPYYTQGSGTPDSRLEFTLADGFIVYSYTQAQLGTYTDTSGVTGGTYRVWVGNTVSGLEGFPGASGSGNGGSSFTVRYIGN
jgi:hypothetical protein